MKIILGLGKTGFSIASLFAREGAEFAVMDSRLSPPMLDEFDALRVDAPCYFGGISTEVLTKASEVIVSPGISLRDDSLKQVPPEKIIGDIELFARRASAPVVGVTGTNGKSTVTTLFAEMCERAGRRVLVGGNIGVPALDLLTLPVPDLYVLELSSFQLAVTTSLKTKAAVILNISEDHLDWHGDMQAYSQAKYTIFKRCECPVMNKKDPAVASIATDVQPSFYNNVEGDGFSAVDDRYIHQDGQRILDVNDCEYAGAHYVENSIVALSLGLAIALPLEDMLQTIKTFKGLPHRTQWVTCSEGVNWYNDSKGTNVAATIAAINALGSRAEGGIILIAGGVDKHADFDVLCSALNWPIKAAFLLGETRYAMAKALKPYTQVSLVDNMEMAVAQASRCAKAGDSVLLSPACASVDMYQNFEQRGEHYMQCVRENT